MNGFFVLIITFMNGWGQVMGAVSIQNIQSFSVCEQVYDNYVIISKIPPGQLSHVCLLIPK